MLPSEDLQTISSYFKPDVKEVFNYRRSISKRRGVGGTAPEAVARQIAAAKEKTYDNQE
jgi:argininosuccinate lyase